MNSKAERKNKRPGKRLLWLKIAITVTVTLIFLIIIALLAGRTVASKGNEELRLEFYTMLSGSPFKGCIKYIFDENSIPDTSPVLPDCISSSADGISVSASGKEILELSVSDAPFSAYVLAVKDPTRLCMGKSTFSHNYISEIKHLENASYAFSAADDRQLNVTVSNGEYLTEEDVTFFGVTEDGILAFGNTKDFTDTELKLIWAQEAAVHTLVHGSMPTSFTPSEHPINVPTLSVGQCADGSLLIVLADGSASADDLTKLFYRYSAVNAAIVYAGEAAGIIYPNGNAASFGKDFDDAQYSHAWLIK